MLNGTFKYLPLPSLKLVFTNLKMNGDDDDDNDDEEVDLAEPHCPLCFTSVLPASPCASDHKCEPSGAQRGV